MKRVLMILVAFALTACAGVTQYEISPTCPYPADECKDPAKWMYSAKVISGKNAGSVVVHIARTADGGVTFDLNEQQINGSDSIKAAAAPVSDVAHAVSDTAKTVQQLSKGIP